MCDKNEAKDKHTFLEHVCEKTLPSLLITLDVLGCEVTKKHTFSRRQIHRAIHAPRGTHHSATKYTNLGKNLQRKV